VVVLSSGPAEMSLAVGGVFESSTGHDGVTVASHLPVTSVGLDFGQETDKRVQVRTEVGKIGGTRGTASNIVTVGVGPPRRSPVTAGLVVHVRTS